MRLPADATLIVIGKSAGEAAATPKIAALLAVWTREALPVIHRGGATATESSGSAFADGGLEAALDHLGATTLVLCGALDRVQATAPDAAALGFHVFVVGDACWPRAGAAPAFADGAAVLVDTAAALAAAATAKARQRRELERKR
jgi:hypothetical protein